MKTGTFVFKGCQLGSAFEEHKTKTQKKKNKEKLGDTISFIL
jgi:hypothetical protein